MCVPRVEHMSVCKIVLAPDVRKPRRPGKVVRKVADVVLELDLHEARAGRRTTAAVRGLGRARRRRRESRTGWRTEGARVGWARRRRRESRTGWRTEGARGMRTRSRGGRRTTRRRRRRRATRGPALGVVLEAVLLPGLLHRGEASSLPRCSRVAGDGLSSTTTAVISWSEAVET
jgi:hypothetical protein